MGTVALSPQAPEDILFSDTVSHEVAASESLANGSTSITGATIVESKGMGRVLSREVPIFAGLRTLAAASRPANRTIFCLADDAKIDAAITLSVEPKCWSNARRPELSISPEDEDALTYAMQFARDMPSELTDRFVAMWVNDMTLDYGERGKEAVKRLLQEGYEKGIIKTQVEVDFVE